MAELHPLTTGPNAEPARDEVRAQQLVICSYATDVEDAKLLLEILGFLPYESATAHDEYGRTNH
jgi:hypothetical protein